MTYYRGALKRGHEVVWECDASAWSPHETRADARACAQKVLDVFKQETQSLGNKK